MRGVIEELRASDFQAGCPISTVALESSGTTNPLQAACSSAFHSIQAVIAEGFKKDARSPEEAQALANLILCAFEGALLLSRTHHDTRPLEDMAKTLGALLSRRKTTP